MKKMQLALLSLALVSTFAFSSSANAGNRSAHKMGISVGLLTDPFPSMYGGTFNYNITEWLRGRVGIGFVSLSDSTLQLSATTISGEAMLSIPDWGFSPVATIGFSNVSMTITGTGSLSGVGGLTGSGSALHGGFGFDWQTSGGFNLGLAYKILFQTGDGAPGIYLGWYF
ncbi:MAG: hypothetical protein JNL01_12445 [Bdellovibrionales bacterium]|nr:hypothetical protein [Bdellovibrionales bacterium]